MRGFTLIEAVIVLAIVLILAAVAVPIFRGTAPGDSTSFGPAGMVEMRCIDGYKFAVKHKGLTQVLDENGKGVRCNSASQ